MKCIVLSVCLCVGLLASTKSYGGGSMADYQRANRLDEQTRNTVFRVRVVPHWFDGGDQLWYRLDLAGSEREYVVVNAVTGFRRVAFRASELAAALSRATGRTVSPSDVTLDPIEFSDSDRFATFEKFGR